MTTVNISLPTDMYADAKKVLASGRYASVSELVRDALRRVLYPVVTENGFTPEFEEAVLRAAREPVGKAVELNNDKETSDFFLHLKLPRRYERKNDKS